LVFVTGEQTRLDDVGLDMKTDSPLPPTLSPDVARHLLAEQRRTVRLAYVALAASFVAMTIGVVVLLTVAYIETNLSGRVFASEVILTDPVTENGILVLDGKVQRGVIRVRDSAGVMQDVQLFRMP